MPKITPFMQSVLDSIDEISTKLDQNIFIKNAISDFLAGEGNLTNYYCNIDHYFLQ